MPGLEHAYLLAAVVILVPIYFLIWWERKDLQKKMLRLSLFGAITGPLVQWWYLGDYWNSNITIGVYGFLLDLLVAFLIIGLTAVCANVLCNRRSVNTTTPGKRERYLTAFVIIFGSLFLFSGLLSMPSLYASAIGFLTVAFLIWRERKDLQRYSFIGGFSLLSFGLVCYLSMLVVWPALVATTRWDILPIANFAVPLKEFFWLFSWGLVGSVIYEWRHGYIFKSRIDHGHH